MTEKGRNVPAKAIVSSTRISGVNNEYSAKYNCSRQEGEGQHHAAPLLYASPTSNELVKVKDLFHNR